MQRHKTHSSHSNERGFTIVELVTAILVLSILVAISINSVVGYQAVARDREREADTDVISKNIERYYRTNAVAVGATYPPTSTGVNNLTTLINDTEATTAPQQTTSSMVIATSAAAQSPTVSQYVYQPLNIDNTLCTTAPCVKYKLYFRYEDGNEIVVRNSLRQQ